MNRRVNWAVGFLCMAMAPDAALGQTDGVRAAEKGWVTAITKNDLAALDRLLANELVYTHSSGVVETKAEYIGVLRTGAQKYDAVDYEDTKVMTYGNVGVVAAAVRMRGASKGQPFDNRLRMLHVWVERDGRWQLVAHQTTRLP